MPKKEKNIAGFSKKHLQLLLHYCIATRKDPRMYFNLFHRKYSSYSRVQSTIDLIRRAEKQEVIAEPMIYANVGIEVEILKDINDPRRLLEECENNPNIRLAYSLCEGNRRIFIIFKRGASLLSFYQNVIPSFYFEDSSIEGVVFREKGELPRDPYPHGWTRNHWAIYESLRFPRRETFRNVGRKVGLAWESVRKYYREVLNQCKVFTSFFPIGRNGYSFQVVLFKTEYELGVLKALKKLNRTSYLYKFQGTIMLGLFLGPDIKAYQKSADRFAYLEEIGLIRDLSISIPLNYSREAL